MSNDDSFSNIAPAVEDPKDDSNEDKDESSNNIEQAEKMNIDKLNLDKHNLLKKSEDSKPKEDSEPKRTQPST